MHHYLLILARLLSFQINYCMHAHAESGSSVSLSTPGIVSVCPGENLHFMCSTNWSFIEWNITVVQSRLQSRTKLVSDISPLPMLIVNGIIFSITRNSSLRSHRWTSTLSVANVTADLNGTIVKCTAIEHSTLEIDSLLTTVLIIRADISELQRDFIYLTIATLFYVCFYNVL